MPSLMEILNDPDYINANEATKQAIFDKYSATDENFVNANPATQDAIRVRFGVATPSEDTGALKAFGKGALRGALPAAAGIITGAAGAAAGSAAGPIGTVAGGLSAGFAGSAAASAAQEKFLEENPKIAKALGLDAETAAKEAKAHPYASMAGEIAPNLVAFRPSGAMFRSAKGLEKAAAERVIAERNAAIINSALNTGVGAGVQVGQEAMGEEPIDWTKVGIAALGGALGQKETAVGRGLSSIGEIPASAATRATLNAIRRPTPNVAPENAPKLVETPSTGEPTIVGQQHGVDYGVMQGLMEGKSPEIITPKPTVESPQGAVAPVIKPVEVATPEVFTPIVKPTLPEKISSGGPGGTFKTTPIDRPSLFHETSPRNAAELIREDLYHGDRPVGRFFLADNPDIALGQGGNKGVKIEYDGSLVSGLEHKKPMTGDLAGREYIADGIAGNAIKSIEIAAGEKLPFPPNVINAVKKNFDVQKTEDGRTILTRKEEAPTAEPIVEKPVAVAEQAPEVTPEAVTPQEAVSLPSEKLSAEHQELAKTLRKAMDDMGLNHVGLKLEDSLDGYVNGKLQPVNGKYLENMISLSLKGTDMPSSMNHEALHAMRDNGFFSDAEWKILSNKAINEWMKKYNIEKAYGNLSKELQYEEAIAKAFADFRKQTPEVKSIISRAMATLQRIGNVLRGRGFRNHEDIFTAAGEGKLSGKRDMQKAGARFEVAETPPVTARNVMGQEVAPTFPTPEVTKKTEFIRMFQDRHIDLKRTMAAIRTKIKDLSDEWDPYQKLGLFPSKVANEFRLFAEKEVDPLVSKMNKLNITNDDIHEYLLNRHAEEFNNQMNKINPDIVDDNGNVIPYKLKDRASSIHTKDAREYLNNLDPKKKADLESIAKDVDKIIDGTHEILVKSGRQTQADIDAWKNTYEHYAPFFREMEDNRLATISRKGFGTRGDISKRAMGSERNVADILNSIIGQREQALEDAERIVVGKSLFGLTLKASNPEIWLPVSPKAVKNPEMLARQLDEMGFDGKDIVGMMEERKTRRIVKDPITGLDKVEYQTNPLERYKDNVLPIRMNGEDSFIFFNRHNPLSANMVRAFNNMDTPTVGLVGKEIGKVTQWMAKVNTQWNPVFGALNFMRDYGAAMANLSNTELAGQQAKVSGGIRQALSTIWHTMRLERAGEGFPDTEWGHLYQEYRNNGGQTLYREQLTRRSDQESMINEKIKKLNSGTAKKMASGFFNALSDFNDSIENAIRLSAYKVARDKGFAPEKAASIAKDLTVNFDRQGAYGKMINNYFAFFNAAAQGTARMTQTLAGPAGKKIALGGIGIGALQAGMMELAGFSDNDPPEFVKSRNFIIPTPDGKYLTIPYPLGLHFLPNIGRIVVETGLHGDFQKHAANMAGVIADSFNPLGGGELSLQTITPTVLDPAVALATNKDPFGRPISRQDRATSPTPGFARSREQSTEVNKKIAEAINYITGGTEDTKGFLSPTADQLDYLVGQVTGGVGREAMKIGKTAQAVATGDTENLASYNIPLVGRFYGDINSPAANSQHFYDNVTKMAEYENTIKGMRERKENVAEFLANNPEAKFWQQANNAENQISAINKQQKKLRDRGAPDEQIKLLDDKKQQIMTRFNERIKPFQQ